MKMIIDPLALCKHLEDCQSIPLEDRLPSLEDREYKAAHRRGPRHSEVIFVFRKRIQKNVLYSLGIKPFVNRSRAFLALAGLSCPAF